MRSDAVNLSRGPAQMEGTRCPRQGSRYRIIHEGCLLARHLSQPPHLVSRLSSSGPALTSRLPAAQGHKNFSTSQPLTSLTGQRSEPTATSHPRHGRRGRNPPRPWKKSRTRPAAPPAEQSRWLHVALARQAKYSEIKRPYLHARRTGVAAARIITELPAGQPSLGESMFPPAEISPPQHV